jgi:hypothetical protein
VTRAAARALVACAGLALGCLTPEPVLYPNDTARTKDQAEVDRDIEECGKLAEEYNAKSKSRGGEVAQSTVEDATIGGAAGAVGGAVTGNAGAGAAAGAAAGATAGLVRGLFRLHREPDPAYRIFVERCLGERGYEVIGWE